MAKRQHRGRNWRADRRYVTAVPVYRTDSREHRIAFVQPVSPVQLVLLQVRDKVQVCRQRHLPAQHAPFQTTYQVIATPPNEPDDVVIHLRLTDHAGALQSAAHRRLVHHPAEDG